MVRKDTPKRTVKQDPLEQLLKSKDILERLRAVDMLKERGNKDKLIELLYSNSWHVRERAALYIPGFGEDVKDAIPPLLEERFWYVRAAAAYVVGELGDERTFAQLRTMLTEKNETVRGEVARAVAKIIRKRHKLFEELEPEERISLENTLKSLKEFELLEGIRQHAE
jgi:HEAT repeat protein